MRGKAALLAIIAALPGTGGAQTPTREEIRRAPDMTTRPGASRLTVEGEIERAPCPLADAQYKDITVTIARAQFNGLGAIPESVVAPSWAGLAGKTVPLAEICDIRDRAATALRRAGYLAAVQVPPQRIEGGIVSFDVLSARLVGFQVRGRAGRSEAAIERLLEGIRQQPVFNVRSAERYLLLARDLPGFDIRMTLRPAGTVSGEVIGEVLVERTPASLTLNVQNLGSREVGRFGGIAQLNLNGIFGSGDRTAIGVFSTSDFKEQQVVLASQEFRIGREGLTIGADFNYAWTRPTLAGAIDLRSRTLVATLRAAYPLVRRQATNLTFGGGFDFIDQSSRIAGIPLTEDHLRTGWLRADFERIDPASIGSTAGYSLAEPRWRFEASLELRQGIAVLGATRPCGPAFANCTGAGVVPPSRLSADPTAFVMRGDLAAEFRPIPELGLRLIARGQYAPRPLLSYEQFSAGNYTIGRGFDPGTLIGDSGLGLRGEMTGGSLVPSSRKDLAVQGYGFVDAAWVWASDPVVGTPNPQKLQSAGGGVRAAFGDRFQLDAGVAVPFRAAGLQTQRGDTRVLISLTVKLLPWRR